MLRKPHGPILSSIGGMFKMKVVCLDNTNMERVLTVGEIYQVLKVGKFGDEYQLVADDGEVWRCHIKRFKVVED